MNPSLSVVAAFLFTAAATIACDGNDSATGGSGGTAGSGGDSGDSGGAANGGAANGGAGGATAWESYCEDLVAREETCDPENPPSPSLNECVDAEQCFNAVFRTDARVGLTDCLRNRACDKSDDACFGEVGATLPATPEQTSYKTACDMKFAACPGAFSDDWCTGGDVPWQLFPPSVHTTLSACFAKACGEVDGCLDDATETLLAPCGGELGI